MNNKKNFLNTSHYIIICFDVCPGQLRQLNVVACLYAAYESKPLNGPPKAKRHVDTVRMCTTQLVS